MSTTMLTALIAVFMSCLAAFLALYSDDDEEG